jgi:prolyl-tRNA editing enzyme YbaK/EbsC (Cys-tRNA(Pro) deacylase)
MENGEHGKLVARIVRPVWPEAVERVAIFLRTAGVQGQLEELLPGTELPPDARLEAIAFECEGRVVVALLQAGYELDRRKLAAAAGCGPLRPVPAPGFPFAGAAVFLHRTGLTAANLWLEAGSPGHVLGLAPAQLTQLTGAKTADLAAET